MIDKCEKELAPHNEQSLSIKHNYSMLLHTMERFKDAGVV